MREARTFVSLVTFALLIACSKSGPGAASDAIYTSLREADCSKPPPEIAAPYLERDLGVQQCPAPPSWRLLLVSSDANTWLDVRGPALEWSSERAIVYEMPIGLFPSVDTATDVEWRRNAAGAPTALIVRVQAQDRDTLTARQSRIFVVRLASGSACVIGRVMTIADARALADGDRGC